MLLIQVYEKLSTVHIYIYIYIYIYIHIHIHIYIYSFFSFFPNICHYGFLSKILCVIQ